SGCCQVQSGFIGLLVRLSPWPADFIARLYASHLPCATFRSPLTLLWSRGSMGGNVIGCWAPVPTPHAAARPVICHGPLYRHSHAAARSRVCHGSCTASHCCCLHRHNCCHVPLSGSPHTAGGFSLL
ncbi:unnamed protein product, partial [Staurois parvus]